MQHDDDPQPGRGKRSLVLPAAIAALVILMVVLHLTGVVGSGSH